RPQIGEADNRTAVSGRVKWIEHGERPARSERCDTAETEAVQHPSRNAGKMPRERQVVDPACDEAVGDVVLRKTPTKAPIEQIEAAALRVSVGDQLGVRISDLEQQTAGEGLLNLRLQRVVPGVSRRNELAEPRLDVRVQTTVVYVVRPRRRNASPRRNRNKRSYRGIDLLLHVLLQAPVPDVAYACHIALQETALDRQVVLVGVGRPNPRVYGLRELEQRGADFKLACGKRIRKLTLVTTERRKRIRRKRIGKRSASGEEECVRSIEARRSQLLKRGVPDYRVVEDAKARANHRLAAAQQFPKESTGSVWRVGDSDARGKVVPIFGYSAGRNCSSQNRIRIADEHQAHRSASAGRYKHRKLRIKVSQLTACQNLRHGARPVVRHAVELVSDG